MIPPHQLIELSCKLSGATPRSLLYANRKSDTIIARHLTMYMLYYHGGLMTHRIAELFDFTEAAIRQAMKSIQKARYQKQPTQHQKRLKELINEANGYFNN